MKLNFREYAEGAFANAAGLAGGALGGPVGFLAGYAGGKGAEMVGNWAKNKILGYKGPTQQQSQPNQQTDSPDQWVIDNAHSGINSPYVYYYNKTNGKQITLPNPNYKKP